MKIADSVGSWTAVCFKDISLCGSATGNASRLIPYGDRLHERVDPAAALEEIVARTVARGGTVIIPAFAVGRAQSLLYWLRRLKESGRLGNVPVFLDSPMAVDASELLCRHLQDHRLSEHECRTACGVATYVRSTEDSKALTANPVPI